MTMSKAYDRTLEAWAKDYRQNYFTPEVAKAVRLANYDLHFGPANESDCAEPPTDEYGNENEWSGFSFEKACETIKEALSNLPHVIYINDQFEDWQSSEPTGEECSSCDGKGENTDEDGDVWKCSDCAGIGHLDVEDGWWQVDKKDLVKAIVGKE